MLVLDPVKNFLFGHLKHYNPEELSGVDLVSVRGYRDARSKDFYEFSAPLRRINELATRNVSVGQPWDFCHGVLLSWRSVM